MQPWIKEIAQETLNEAHFDHAVTRIGDAYMADVTGNLVQELVDEALSDLGREGSREKERKSAEEAARMMDQVALPCFIRDHLLDVVATRAEGVMLRQHGDDFLKASIAEVLIERCSDWVKTLREEDPAQGTAFSHQPESGSG